MQLHVADVMGKGIPAALIAASVQALLVGAVQLNDQQTAFARAAASADLLSGTGAFVIAFSARPRTRRSGDGFGTPCRKSVARCCGAGPARPGHVHNDERVRAAADDGWRRGALGGQGGRPSSPRPAPRR
ncbi:SpoIIE family protein phosphatase [Kocuria sp. SM24M-10]|uniref:SpoIIE family protein phosphatase n=1 Tax=Kocuria sp. SM24M-10 TaxID=1660349 RepID=UPI00128AF8AF